MVAFPLETPASFGISAVDWGAFSNDAYALNPWSLQLNKQIFGGRMWRGTLTIRPQSGVNGRKLSAWLASLKRSGANAGTFFLGDPSASLPKGSARDTPGTPLVNGASQTGEALNIDGLPFSATGYLLPGDYIQVGTGISSRLKKVLDQVDSDGAGLATVNVWPPITIAPSNGSSVVVSGAEGLFISPDNLSSWQITPPEIYKGIQLTVMEVVT